MIDVLDSIVVQVEPLVSIGSVFVMVHTVVVVVFSIDELSVI